MNQPNFRSTKEKAIHKNLFTKSFLVGLASSVMLGFGTPVSSQITDPLKYYGVDTTPKTEYYDTNLVASNVQFQDILDEMPYFLNGVQKFQATYNRYPKSQADYKQVFFTQLTQAGKDAGTSNESTLLKADQLSLKLSQEFASALPKGKSFESTSREEFATALRALSSEVETLPETTKYSEVLNEKLQNLKVLRAPEILDKQSMNPQINNQPTASSKEQQNRDWFGGFKKWIIPLAAMSVVAYAGYKKRKQLKAKLNQLKTKAVSPKEQLVKMPITQEPVADIDYTPVYENWMTEDVGSLENRSNDDTMADTDVLVDTQEAFTFAELGGEVEEKANTAVEIVGDEVEPALELEAVDVVQPTSAEFNPEADFWDDNTEAIVHQKPNSIERSVAEQIKQDVVQMYNVREKIMQTPLHVLRKENKEEKYEKNRFGKTLEFMYFASNYEDQIMDLYSNISMDLMALDNVLSNPVAYASALFKQYPETFKRNPLIVSNPELYDSFENQLEFAYQALDYNKNDYILVQAEKMNEHGDFIENSADGIGQTFIFKDSSSEPENGFECTWKDDYITTRINSYKIISSNSTDGLTMQNITTGEILTRKVTEFPNLWKVVPSGDKMAIVYERFRKALEDSGFFDEDRYTGYPLIPEFVDTLYSNPSHKQINQITKQLQILQKKYKLPIHDLYLEFFDQTHKNTSVHDYFITLAKRFYGKMFRPDARGSYPHVATAMMLNIVSIMLEPEMDTKTKKQEIEDALTVIAEIYYPRY